MGGRRSLFDFLQVVMEIMTTGMIACWWILIVLGCLCLRLWRVLFWVGIGYPILWSAVFGILYWVGRPYWNERPERE